MTNFSKFAKYLYATDQKNHLRKLSEPIAKIQAHRTTKISIHQRANLKKNDELEQHNSLRQIGSLFETNPLFITYHLYPQGDTNESPSRC